MALACATVAIAAAVYVVRLPQPTDTIVVDHVVAQADSGPRADRVLPQTIPTRAGVEPARVLYTGHFDLPRLPDSALLLFIPTVDRQVRIALNGQPLFDSADRALWGGPMVAGSVLIHLPKPLLVAGRNHIRLVLDTAQAVLPSYLSKVYIGTEAQIAPYFKLSVVLEERLKTMAMLAHVLLGCGIIAGYLYRRKDPLFSWLAAMVVLSFVISLGTFAGFQPGMQVLLAYIIALTPALGLAGVGVAFAVSGIPPPRLLPAIAVLVPAALMLVAFTGVMHPGTFIVIVGVAFLIVAMVAATGVVAWGAFWQASTEARLMLPPFFLLGWLLIRDAGVLLQLIDRPLIMFTPLGRPLFLAALTAVLMRRLALSLDNVDRANETLNRRLAEREAQLAALHRQERLEGARQVREQERQRLTQDLHDGISGHLVSIIAMSERSGTDVKPIEQAAREALDDLRLVIYSLDLGDRELPLALANFRERLIPRLQRMGVGLDWSTADLPDVSGVTPGNALAILRILQEAITNALKHGPARKITVRGGRADGDMVAITVDNDGRSFLVSDSGFGLRNMRRRAHDLNGEIAIEPRESGARLTLLLPSRLPNVENRARGEAHVHRQRLDAAQ